MRYGKECANHEGPKGAKEGGGTLNPDSDEENEEKTRSRWRRKERKEKKGGRENSKRVKKQRENEGQLRHGEKTEEEISNSHALRHPLDVRMRRVTYRVCVNVRQEEERRGEEESR